MNKLLSLERERTLNSKQKNERKEIATILVLRVPLRSLLTLALWSKPEKKGKATRIFSSWRKIVTRRRISLAGLGLVALAILLVAAVCGWRVVGPPAATAARSTATPPLMGVVATVTTTVVVTSTTVARPPSTTTTPAPAAPVNTTKVSADCPSLAEARRLMGVDLTLVGEEPCAFTFNTGDGSFIPVNLPQGWFATTAEPDQLVWVQDGNGSTGKVTAKAATWRFKSAYPGLTLEKQFELTAGYAALPQNQFAGSVRCRGCAGLTPNAPASGNNPAATPAPTTQAAAQAALRPCPTLSGVQTTEIDGGCLWTSNSPRDLDVPKGLKALYGTPAVWAEGPKTIPGITRASLYSTD